MSLSTNTEELITLQPYRSDGMLSVVISRCRRGELNRGIVYYMATGEHCGIVVNSPIYDVLLLDDSFQIPIVCRVSDQTTGKSLTELRRLIFYFGSDVPENECKAAAKDLHHDLLHPEIFQRDYCGFIITMMKIIQHRYPQIVRLCCRFETLQDDDQAAVLRHLQECYPYKQPAEAISKSLGLPNVTVISSLNTLIGMNLVDEIAGCYVLRAPPSDENISGHILASLRSSGRNGLSRSKILGTLNCPIPEAERVLSSLLKTQKVQCEGGLYYWQGSPPRDDEVEGLLEVLESVFPQGMSEGQIKEKIGGDTASLLDYVVRKGYATEREGLYYIRRLEDKEIELVYCTIKEGGGLRPDQITKLTNFAEIVVLSAINVLEERGDVREEGEHYFATDYEFHYLNYINIEDIPHQVVVHVYDAVPTLKVDPHGNSIPVVAELVGVDEDHSRVILGYLTECQLLSESGGFYHKLAISDVDCTLVLSLLHSGGVGIGELTKSLPHFHRERLWFILRDLVAAQKVKVENELYYPTADSGGELRCSDADIGKVLKTLEGVFPSGLAIREISLKCQLSEPVVRRSLSNLTQRCFVVVQGDKYFSRSFQDDCEEIVTLLKKTAPNGLVLGDICSLVGISSQPLVREILRYLSDHQNCVEMWGRLYFYLPPKSEVSQDSLFRKLVVNLLAENYPKGMTLEEIKRCDPSRHDSISWEDMQALLATKSIYEENGKFFYNQQFALCDSDYEQILKVLEAAYPNSLTLGTICKESKMSEKNVAIVLQTLMEHRQVTEVDRDVFIRSETILDKSMKKGEVEDTMDPTIAIITSDYSVKVCTDLMMSNITTYFKYKLGGESSVYTLGTIGGRRVVATKFSHGYSQALAISAGNSTTRLLGTFPRIEHVIILGLGGGVVETEDLSRHVRLGDVVASVPGEDNSIYFMATNFNFPELSDLGDSTVTYTVKRWNCLDPQLHQRVKEVHDATAGLGVFPWEEYITQGQTALSNDLTSQDFHRPALMMDPLSQTRRFEKSVLPRELEGRPRMCLGAIGAGRHLHKFENLKEQFVERSRVIAFNDEYDQVTESIHGNCVDSFMFIHGISDYTDGTENGLWHSYAALSAASVMKYLVENM